MLLMEKMENSTNLICVILKRKRFKKSMNETTLNKKNINNNMIYTWASSKFNSKTYIYGDSFTMSRCFF